MVVSTLLGFLYPAPPSLFVNAMSVITALSLGNAGFAEIRGTHMQYSKFWNTVPQSSKPVTTKQIKIASKTGMLMAYTPAFLAGVASFALLPNEDFRVLLVKSSLTIHFFKRVCEALFVHKYSGNMMLDSMIPISASYCISTSTLIYAQYLTEGLPEPSLNLMYAGIPIFLIGLSGNLYHHYLLSKLREGGESEYKIPKGGLFGAVVCPHYLFEILVFVGVSCIAQTVYAFSFTLGTSLYLMGRSYATRKWYLSKFEDFPRDVKALIPFLF